MTSSADRKASSPAVSIDSEARLRLPMDVHTDDVTGVTSISIHIPLSADAAFSWDVVRDISAVDTRLIPGFATSVEPGPGTRTVTFANGMTVTERIIEINDDDRRLRYQAIDGPATHHLGTQSVTPDDAGSHLVWTTEFSPPTLLDLTINSMCAAAELMRTTIDAAFARRA